MDTVDRVSLLLVDDQPSRLLSYEAILADLGQDLVTARSGTEALQLLMEREFAAILMDVNMPGMDGFETATLIHQHPRFEQTPIIFVTAVHVTDLDRLKGYTLGAVDYVYVPVVPEILRGKVQVLVELHKKRRELQRLNAALALANAELAVVNTNLQAEKARELERLNRSLEAANAGLSQANEALQKEVAERKRAEAALQEASERKDEFLAILSHELRNPLAAIGSAVKLIYTRELIDPRLICARGVLERQTSHLTRLIDDLFDVSRISRGQITLRPEPIELAALIERAVEATQPLIQARRHRLVVQPPPDAVWLQGDLVRLTQAVGNLLSNAAKYTPDGGQIELLVEQSGGTEVAIRVRDTGVGIAAEHLPQMFQLFRRFDHPLERAEDGLGVGLALARRLMELHGGSIEAHSEGVGRGSEFVLRMPALVAPPQPAQAPSPAAPVISEQSQLNVLIVDDNIDSAQTLAMLLQLSGHDVRIAHTGTAGLEAATKQQPDCMLLDIGLPGMNGYEVARRLRALSGFDSVFLVAVTGYGRQRDRQQTQQAGFDDHLVKPIEFDRLKQLLLLAAARRPSPERKARRAGGH